MTVDNFGYYHSMICMVDMVGVQQTVVSGEKFCARFVFGMDSLKFYVLKVNYWATINGEEHWSSFTPECADIENVYKTIQVSGMPDVTAEGLGYQYLSALTFEDIPAVGTVKIYIETGAASNAWYVGMFLSPTYCSTFIDGVFQSLEIEEAIM